jgi:hypothetical protein
MLFFRNSVLFSSFFCVISLFFPLRAMPQAQMISGLLPGTSAFPGSLQGCREQRFFASKFGNDELTPYSRLERSNANQVCKEFPFDVPSPRFSWKDVPPSSPQGVYPSGELENGSRTDTPPPPGELKDIGRQGTTVARVRQAVLEILESENACSAWFRRTDPQVQATFRSLKFLVDEDGPHYKIRDRDGRGDWVEHGPYVARTKQNTGPGTAITLNANGAFFRTKGEIYKVNWIGAEPRETGTWRHLEVGPYDGGTLQAQVIVVLHELAHVIGAIPWDDSSQVGYYRSQQNTELILHYCRAEANASPKRLKLAMVHSPAN